MTAHHGGDGNGNGSHLNGGPSLEGRVGVLEDWKDAAEERIFVALGQLTAMVREANAHAKSADATSALVAAQFHAVHGDVQVAKRDVEAVRREVRDVRAEAYRGKLESHHDIEDTQRKTIMSAEEAAKRIARAEADAVRLEHAKDQLAKAEHFAEKRDDRTHDYKVHGFSKGLAAVGAVFMAMAAVIAYLLTHGSPLH